MYAIEIIKSKCDGIINECGAFAVRHFSKALAALAALFIVAVCRYLSVELEKLQLMFTPDYGFFQTTTVNMYKHREIIRYVLVCATLYVFFIAGVALKNNYSLKETGKLKMLVYFVIVAVCNGGVWYFNSHFSGVQFWSFACCAALLLGIGFFVFFRKRRL